MIVRGEWPQGEGYLRAGYQTAGRGPTGNGWESEEGKNLLGSILVEGGKWKVERSFDLNVAVSVAVRRVLGEGFTIKWPNDIYYGDKKVAGILIENVIIGSEVKYSIAGIGLNVNQTEFRSDAPNPISLKQITGKDYDLEELMEQVYAEVQKALKEDVWGEYMAHLYRREGFWPFVEREVSTVPTMNADKQAEGIFMARIEDVLPTGEIVLKDQKGKERIYHFKQVRYVL